MLSDLSLPPSIHPSTCLDPAVMLLQYTWVTILKVGCVNVYKQLCEQGTVRTARSVCAKWAGPVSSPALAPTGMAEPQAWVCGAVRNPERESLG